jgi:hypothetical protein
MGIGDVAWRKRPEDHPGEQVAGDDWQFQAMGDCGEHERRDEPADDGGDQSCFVVHA